MKINFFLLLISLITLQSCRINSEIVYHKDAASSTVMDIDVRKFIAEMKAMSPDSLNKKEFGEMDKVPTTWTSIYELDKKEGKLKTTNPDSIKIMKKIFMKSNKENNEYAGFSLKLDHFSKSDYNALGNLSKGNQLPVDQNVFNDWDGKVLTLNTDNFNLKNIEEALRSKTTKEESQSVEGLVMMMFKQIGTTLKFDDKIKSVQGKHDWFKQIDDHTIRIEYDLKTLYDKDYKFKNSDKKIVVVTE
ncbi:hypothetical protein IQ37_09265 [Chryseobacterium piperi]|uniref:Lipoprotein n=1 Tax=Chryseobacterium piperi TaxID=558152 RepID=A0A086BIF7_9FLAO|nr:hypothetical protein [Chryseobacterium piperi]ASW75547.1 hypothetical protein CJF12_15500 [Chryseobacterium piperi]KFF28721.1 hypothetical protein IQ37_09265 [Chryseobacterium piperi]